MKKLLILCILILIAGCLLPGSRNMREIVTSVDSAYSVDIIKECEGSDLQSVMYGDIEQFLEFGCDSCLVADIKDDSGTYRVELLSFMNSKGALGAYLSAHTEDSPALKYGYISRKTHTGIQFVKGTTIVSIKNESGTESGEQSIASRLARMVRGDALRPDVFELLPSGEKESEFYFMGPKAFASKFSKKLADVLMIEQAEEGIAAVYKIRYDKVTFLMVKYSDREQTLMAVDSFIKRMVNRPVIPSRKTIEYYTVVNPDRSETYIAESTDWLLLLTNGPQGGKAQSLFEYFLRSKQ